MSGRVEPRQRREDERVEDADQERRAERGAEAVEREPLEDPGQIRARRRRSTTTAAERRSVSSGSEKPSDAGLGSMGMENYPASPGAEGDSTDPEVAKADAVIVQKHEPTLRGIVRVVATVVASAITLYLIYLLRTPIGWLFVATFVAVSVAAPVGLLERRMPRGAAIAIVYLTLVLIPIGIGVILIPPAVTAGSDLVNDTPGYVEDLNQTVQDNDTLRGLNQDYDLVGKLEDVANNAAGSLDDVACDPRRHRRRADQLAVRPVHDHRDEHLPGLAAAMAGSGRCLATRRPEEADAIDKALERMAIAVSSYVGGALAQATIAGIVAFIVLTILGVPAPLALAVIIAMLDLIPLVGATIGAVPRRHRDPLQRLPDRHDHLGRLRDRLPAVRELRDPAADPEPRRRARPVRDRSSRRSSAARCSGSSGALLAIPVAAAGQIGVREFMLYRRGELDRMGGDLDEGLPLDGPGSGEEGTAPT